MLEAAQQRGLSDETGLGAVWGCPASGKGNTGVRAKGRGKEDTGAGLPALVWCCKPGNATVKQPRQQPESLTDSRGLGWCRGRAS